MTEKTLHPEVDPDVQLARALALIDEADDLRHADAGWAEALAAVAQARAIYALAVAVMPRLRGDARGG